MPTLNVNPPEPRAPLGAVLGPLVRPREMLLEEFLRPRGLHQSAVAEELGISRSRLNELVLGQAFGGGRHRDSPRAAIQDAGAIWLHLQADYDLQVALNHAGVVGRRAKRPRVEACWRKRGRSPYLRLCCLLMSAAGARAAAGPWRRLR